VATRGTLTGERPGAWLEAPGKRSSEVNGRSAQTV